jgi:hypothetical protein
MILVVAGAYEDFLDYCREKGLNPHSRPTAVRYVQSYNDFLVDAAELVLYNGFEKNPVYENEETWSFLMEYGKSRKWTGI